jgi:DNA-binding LytR/AlgR family response regulator
MRTLDEYVGHDLLQVKDIRFPRQEDGSRPSVPIQRIAVRSVNRIMIVRVADIVRLEADDNYVRLWADRPYMHKETLTGLIARLDPLRFLRIHRSHGVNVGAVREFHPLTHGGVRGRTQRWHGTDFRAQLSAGDSGNVRARLKR